MLAALASGEVEVVLDEITTPAGPSIALVVKGRLTNLPRFVGETEGGLELDPQGLPVPVGTRDAPFRIVVPTGVGDYRVVMYSHGMGGDVDDDAFDAVITQSGAAKVGIQFDGWSEETILSSVSHFGAAVKGSNTVAGRLVEGLAMGSAIQHALDGQIGDLLAAQRLGDIQNPAAGRRPIADKPVWAGGSLGGVMGMVYASAEPSIAAAVINVPGAGFSHFLRFSELFQVLNLYLQGFYDSPADISLALAMAQVNLDMADGGAWADVPDPKPVLLIQESIGDPVLPNIGSELAAAAAGALHLGEVLTPVVGLTTAQRAVNRSALTQYKVTPGSSLDIHGFAEKDTVAGRAAQEQIRDFIHSHWAGESIITLPSACLENEPPMSCDFSP